MGLLLNSLFFSIFILLSPSFATEIPKIYSEKDFNETHLRNTSTHDYLIQLGDASINKKALQLTDESIQNNRFNNAGRFMLNRRFKLWEDGSSSTSSQNNTNSSDNEIVASFNTTFLVNFFVPAHETSGEGFTFLIAPDLNPPPLNSYGEWLGLTNSTLNGNPSQKFVAIEFDTKKQDYDIDANHVGLNINDVRSNRSVPLSMTEFPLAPVNVRVKYRVWVQYNGTTKLLEVYIDHENKTTKPVRPILSKTINLKDYVNQYSYVGFSASTGPTSGQLNCVLEWDLSMEILSEEEPKEKSSWWKIVVGVGSAALVLIATASVWILYCLKRNQSVC